MTSPYNAMSVDELKKTVEFTGHSWAEVAETENSGQPTEEEVARVREYLNGKLKHLACFTLHDYGMFAKGYHYKLIPLDNSFEPLYSKYLSNVGELLASYPDKRFLTVRMAALKHGSTIGGQHFSSGHVVQIAGRQDGFYTVTAARNDGFIGESVLVAGDLNFYAETPA